MHGCELCSGPFDTAGELLAWHARNATQIIRNATGRSGANFNGTVMTWDDMFNPHHNAGDDYFLVNGTLNGQITARSVQLGKTTKVNGDILHESLSIEASAFVHGMCRNVEQDRLRPDLVLHTVQPRGGSRRGQHRQSLAHRVNQ